jgi:hypothetical protein
MRLGTRRSEHRCKGSPLRWLSWSATATRGAYRWTVDGSANREGASPAAAACFRSSGLPSRPSPPTTAPAATSTRRTADVRRAYLRLTSLALARGSDSSDLRSYESHVSAPANRTLVAMRIESFLPRRSKPRSSFDSSWVAGLRQWRATVDRAGEGQPPARADPRRTGHTAVSISTRPCPRPRHRSATVTPLRIKRIDVLDGLIHEYRRAA